MTASQEHTTGSLGEEAARLLDAVGARWCRGTDQCRVCPVCRAVGVLRGTRPEVVVHLADAAASLAAALRAARDSAPGQAGHAPTAATSPAGDGHPATGEPGEAGDEPGAAADERTADRPAATEARFERIDVR